MAKINVDMASALRQAHLTFTVSGVDRATHRVRRWQWLLRIWGRLAGIGGVEVVVRSGSGAGTDRQRVMADELDRLSRISVGGAKVDQPEGSRVVILSDTLLRRIAAELRGAPDEPTIQPRPAVPPEPPAGRRSLWPWRQA